MGSTIIRRGKKWSVVIDRGWDVDDDGKRIRKRDWHSGFTRKRDAEAKRVELLNQLANGVYVEASKATFAEFADRWLEAKKATVAPTTLGTYLSDLNAHVLPALGPRRVQHIAPGELNALYADLLDHGGRQEQGLSPKTVRNIHALIRKVLADAEKWGVVARNAAAVADPPKVPRPAVTTWTAEQAKAFLDAVQEDRMYALWRLLATTGMRRSEALGLRWRNVDMERGTIAVADTMTMVANQPTLRTGATKTSGSARTITLDDTTVTALKEHRRAQNEDRLRAGPLWHDLGLVFCWEDGRVLSGDWVTRRARKLTEQAGLPWVGLHAGLRHGWATWALQSGVPVKVVSERLGHATVMTTLDRYSHVIEGMDREAANTVADILS